MPKSEPVSPILAAIILGGVALIGAAVAWVVFFGKTVESKFSKANHAVTSDVTFDGPSSSSSAPPASTRPVEPSPPPPTRPAEASPPAPTRPAVTQSDLFEHGEVINTMRKTRSKRKYRRKSKKSEMPAIMRSEQRSDPPTSSAAPASAQAVAPPVSKTRPAPPLQPDELVAPSAPTAKLAPGEVNPMTQVAEDPLSTFSIDVDTGSYTLARRMLNEDYEVVPDRVRVEEFLNYFRYAYPEPSAGAFGVSLDAAPSPFVAAPNRKIMRVGVQGRRLTAESRKPVHLTFLVDVSGSMTGSARIGLAKESMRILARNLGADDTIAISTYARTVETILEPSSMLRRNQIFEAIDSLKTTGKTQMGDGLERAYKIAMNSFVPGDVNRVIVLSDGDSNLGPTSYSKMFSRIRNHVEEGITLTTVGFGMGNYRDEMMEQLANQGNGNYFYVDSQKEAMRVFDEQLDATLQVIAKDVKIQVEFDPESVVSYRLIGYENRDIADKDFRNDRVDAGEIGAGHSVTALYEIVLSDAAARAAANRPVATVRIRAKTPTGTRAEEQAFRLSSAQIHAELADASEGFLFATAVAGFAEILRESRYAQDIDLALIEELAKSASRPEQEDRQEFIGLVSKARARTQYR